MHILLPVNGVCVDMGSPMGPSDGPTLHQLKKKPITVLKGRTQQTKKQNNRVTRTDNQESQLQNKSKNNNGTGHNGWELVNIEQICNTGSRSGATSGSAAAENTALSHKRVVEAQGLSSFWVRMRVRSMVRRRRVSVVIWAVRRGDDGMC